MTSPEPDSIPQPLIKYIQNFKQTFNQDAENSENSSESLTKTLTSQKRDLHNSKFRSIFWRFYLSCFSNKRSNWANECDIYRSIYKDLKAKFLPIKDEYLVNNVKQDVRRTMPDKKIFREEKIQEMMTDILLLWSIASPCGKRLSYRQGVHEILAPMIFVLKQDHATYSCMKELYAKSNVSNSDDSNLTWPSDIDILLDPKHIEADSFLMLCRLMFFVEPWYGTNQLFKQLQNQTADHNYQQESENELENSTVPNSIAALLDGRMSRSEEEFSKEHIDVKLERIHNSTLRILDFELYQHLKVNDIIPQVYGIRWLRLLFGREFNHEDSLAVWDFIFSFFPQSGPSSNNSNSKDSNSTSSQISTESSKNQTNNYNNHYYTISNITDMVFCSMLTKIRHKLLSGGEQVCVQYLMKYPKITDISLILDQTTKYLEIYPNLYLREKETFGQKALMDSLSNLSIAKGKTLNSMLGSGNKNVSQIISRPTIFGGFGEFRLYFFLSSFVFLYKSLLYFPARQR